MDKPFIFISCGQYLESEKRLGREIKNTIETLSPFEGYFAEDQSSVFGLVANILERLYKCAGFIAVMHERGIVTDDKGNTAVRASVWVEQEIAVASLIQHFVRKEKNDLKVRAYAHKKIKLEGIRTLLQLNPVPFESDEEVLADLRAILPAWQPSQASAIKTLRWQHYEQEMQRLQPEHIEGLRILTLEGPSNDQNALPRLTRKGLAQSWAALFGGMSNSTIFVQPVPGQPPPHRQSSGERMFELKIDAKEFLEDYFTRH